MSSGPVGEGMSYWAAIRISKEMSKEQLEVVVGKIDAILKDNKGAIVSEARASSLATPSFSLRAPDAPQRRGGG